MVMKVTGGCTMALGRRLKTFFFIGNALTLN